MNFIFIVGYKQCVILCNLYIIHSRMKIHSKKYLLKFHFYYAISYAISLKETLLP